MKNKDLNPLTVVVGVALRAHPFRIGGGSKYNEAASIYNRKSHTPVALWSKVLTADLRR
jgi:hypothetical protein